MKTKKIRLMVFLALIGCVTASCTKEELTEKPSAVVAAQSATYVVDGRQYYANPQTEEEWTAFFDRMFALAEEGHTVQFWRNGANRQLAAAKEVVTYTTSDKKKAQKWAEEKEEEGFEVTITFNPQTGEYTCIATR